jgi:tripartite ATP-independent transporter DctM subunit
MLLLAIVFFGLIFLGIPVSVSLAVGGTVGLLFTYGIPVAVVAAKTASATDNVVMLAIPLFILAGSIMTAGGISQRLFDLARVLVGHFPGGLGQVNVALSVFNGGLSGSSAADAAVDCKVTIPQMRLDGYPAAFSGAITAVSGMLSNIIPPSIAFLVYASLTNNSVGKLFVAGIVPGIMLAVAMSIVVHRTCRKMGYGPAKPRPTGREVWTAFKRSAFALLIPLIVVFGIRFGWFTATEAGGVAVLVSFFLGVVVYKELRLRDLPGVLAKTAVDTGVILMIVSFAMPISWVLAYHQIPQSIAAMFNSLTTSPAFFLLAVNLFLLLGGALMEGVSLLILVAPTLASVAAHLGVDPIQFGTIVVLNVVLGSVTPPFGQLVFFVASMTDIKIEDMFKHIFSFLPILLLVLLIVTYVPSSYMWTVKLFGP